VTCLQNLAVQDGTMATITSHKASGAASGNVSSQAFQGGSAWVGDFSIWVPLAGTPLITFNPRQSGTVAWYGGVLTVQ
jgi:hypothetical protein